MAVMQCSLCSYEYHDELEDIPWSELPDDWVCPVCGSPKSVFVPLDIPGDESPDQPKVPDSGAGQESGRYECRLCSNIYDDSAEGAAFTDLPDDWKCPVCGVGKDLYDRLEAGPAVEADAAGGGQPGAGEWKPGTAVRADYLAEWKRPQDDFEKNMADIHQMAESGHPVYEPMGSRLPAFSWNEILIKGAQLDRLPLNMTQPVDTGTIIGPGAAVPMELRTPLLVSHMSYGALSREAKLSLAAGSALAGAGMCSGEGGILPECLDAAYKYIFEYVPNKYSVTDEYLQKADAVEIKIGQSAKPGMGGHLPGDKVTREIAEIRGFREGEDIISPSRFPDIQNPDDLKAAVDMLRSRSGGKPIGVKLAAGHIESDMDIALSAGADFITIDGRAGGTGAALKAVKNSASVPTIFALHRARRFLDERKADNVSLIITGGLRISSDVAKALAMGADAVALATASMMALGCQQYRICNTGRCPVGIATQDPALRARLDVAASTARVANFFTSCTEELSEFARMTGNSSVHDLSPDDLCTVNSELSSHAGIGHA